VDENATDGLVAVDGRVTTYGVLLSTEKLKILMFLEVRSADETCSLDVTYRDRIGVQTLVRHTAV
jgi:hypothetical protein